MSEWARFGTSKIFIVSKVCEIVVPKPDLKQKKIINSIFFQTNSFFFNFSQNPPLNFAQNIRKYSFNPDNVKSGENFL